MTCWLVVASALADADWDNLHVRTVQQYRAGDHVGAAELASQALAAAERQYGRQSVHAAVSLNDRALIAQAEGRIDEALHWSAQAVQVATAVLGAEHDRVLSLQANQGQWLLEAGRYAEATVLYRHVLSAREQQWGERAPALLPLLTALAQSLAGQAAHADAEAVLRRALALPSQQSLSQETAGLHYRLAEVLTAQNRHDEAGTVLQTAVVLLREAASSEPAASLHALERLADWNDAWGNAQQAEALRREALALREQHAPDSVETAQHLNELALLHHQRQQYAQAEPLYRKALGILERHRGSHSPEVALLLGSLAQLKEAQRDDVAALALYQRSLAIHQQNGSQPLYHAQVLLNLGALHYGQRRFAETEPLFLQALGLLESVHGPDDSALLVALDNLVALYRSQKRNREASLYQRRAAALRAEASL